MGNGQSTACTLRQRRGHWFLCIDADQKAEFERGTKAVGQARIEELFVELFHLHDLNRNGTLEESELIKINEKIQVLHLGADADLEQVRKQYKDVFRETLDPEGRPVEYGVFRAHWLEFLRSHDRDLRVQEMILEQFIAEVESARQAFFIKAFHSESDAQFLPGLVDAGALPPTATAALSSEAEPARGTGSGASRQSPQGHSPVKPPAQQDSSCRASLWSLDSDFLPSPAGMQPSAGSSASPPGPPDMCCSLDSDFVPSPQSGHFTPKTTEPVGDNCPQLSRFDSFDSDFVPSPQGMKPQDGTPGLPLGKPFGSCARTGGSPRRAAGAGLSARPLPGLPGAAPAQGPSAKQALSRGDRVEVWSNSKSVWSDAVVQEAFAAQSMADGFAIPAGTVKVSFDSGVKWIMPEQVGSMLRQPRGSSLGSTASFPPSIAKGSAVQVWSESKQAWLDASVEEAFVQAANAEGFFVPAGTLKVSSAAGVKWVLPQQVASMVRESQEPSSPHSGASPTHRPDARATSVASFVQGEKIQVWSDTRQLWLGGVVLEAFAAAGVSDGFAVPAGTVKVSSDAGVKWVAPQLVGKVLRKVDLGSGASAPDLKAVLVEALQDPARLQRHADAVWRLAGCGNLGLSKDHVAWALEGLAMQFNVQLHLEGRHLANVQQCLHAFDKDGDGRLTQVEFQKLSRHVIANVLGSL